MSFAANQARTFLRLVASLRVRWHTDQSLPAAIQNQAAVVPAPTPPVAAPIKPSRPTWAQSTSPVVKR